MDSKINLESNEYTSVGNGWEYIIHSMSYFNPKTFDKIFLEDKALIPNENNKYDWIILVKDYVAKSNLSEDIKNMVEKFNDKTNIIEEFIKNPSLTNILSVIEKYPDFQMFPAVYTQYIFENMNYTGKYWMYTDYKIILLINPQILLEKPFFACKGVSFGSCVGEFEEGFYGKGKDGDKSDMRKYQEYINVEIQKNRKKLENDIKMYQERIEREKSDPNPDDELELKGSTLELKFEKSTYELTNEILFDSIPTKYIKAILLTKYDPDIMDPKDYKRSKKENDREVYELWLNLTNLFSKIDGPKVFIIEDKDRDFQTLFNKKGLIKILKEL